MQRNTILRKSYINSFWSTNRFSIIISCIWRYVICRQDLYTKVLKALLQNYHKTLSLNNSCINLRDSDINKSRYLLTASVL
jgi:hypothetical protein